MTRLRKEEIEICNKGLFLKFLQKKRIYYKYISLTYDSCFEYNFSPFTFFCRNDYMRSIIDYTICIRISLDTNFKLKVGEYGFYKWQKISNEWEIFYLSNIKFKYKKIDKTYGRNKRARA